MSRHLSLLWPLCYIYFKDFKVGGPTTQLFNFIAVQKSRPSTCEVILIQGLWMCNGRIRSQLTVGVWLMRLQSLFSSPTVPHRHQNKCFFMIYCPLKVGLSTNHFSESTLTFVRYSAMAVLHALKCVSMRTKQLPSACFMKKMVHISNDITVQ